MLIKRAPTTCLRARVEDPLRHQPKSEQRIRKLSCKIQKRTATLTAWRRPRYNSSFPLLTSALKQASLFYGAPQSKDVSECIGRFSCLMSKPDAPPDNCLGVRSLLTLLTRGKWLLISDCRWSVPTTVECFFYLIWFQEELKVRHSTDFVLHTDLNRIEISHCLCQYQKLRLKPTPLTKGRWLPTALCPETLTALLLIFLLLLASAYSPSWLPRSSPEMPFIYVEH